MKGKFKILGHIGLTLFLLSALMLALVPVVPVAAATAITNAWVEFPAADAGGTADTGFNLASGLPLYRIHFTATTALKRGVDTITVQFPDGSDTTMGPSGGTYAFTVGTACSTAGNFDVDPDGPGVTYGYYDCVFANYGGKRITVTIGADVPAGNEVYLMIDDAANMVTSGAYHETTPYKVKVNTSKDTTPVLSKGFYLGDSADQVSSTSVSVSPDSAGSTGEYTVTFTAGTALVANTDTITVTFPYGTTVPSSIAASSVSVYNAGDSTWYTCGQAPDADASLRSVAVTVPHAITTAAGSKIKFATTAGITNPTTAYAYWGFTTTAGRVGFIRTSEDRQDTVMDADGYAVTYSTATKLAFASYTSAYSDKYTMINMYSSVLYLEVEDTYGNAVTGGAYASAEVTLSSSSATGNFYTGTTDLVSGNQALTSGAVSLRYKDSTAGTHTLTAAYSGLTSATWSMVVVSGVALYDSNNNLINTYAPTTSSSVQENGGYHSGDYINDAITAAMQGDTVKLGTGTYELDTVITLNKKITLTSVSGASSTTLVPTTDAIDAITVGVTGTAAYPVVIDGLTVDRLRYGVEFDQGVYNNGWNYVTVRNCVFNYIIPANEADHEWGAVVGFISYSNEAGSGSASITSATISNNTFTNCCTFTTGAKAAVINVFAKSSDYTITGVTVSGNTLTDCNGYGIAIKGHISSASYYVVASVTNNTVTNGMSPISIQGYTGYSTTSGVSVTGNTVTGGYMYGIRVETTQHLNLVIKNNTITGCAGAMSSMSCALRIDADGGTGANTVQYNAIYNNDAEYSIGVYSNIGAQDCQYNYFGDATGPAYTALTGATVTKSNPNGAGKKVSDYVTYYPWLHKSLANVVADNASYQANTMKLVSGWNTLSTPAKLIAEADAINELIPSGMTIGYYYSGGWQQITTGYVLNPCDAVYVKMSAVTYVLLKFDASAFSTPSKSLAVGWNLMSLAYLSSSGKSDLATVASVAKTAANLPGYSQLVSPSLNATQTNMFGTAGTSWAYAYGEGTANTCFAGLGYWVYMQNAATLAGFEITPIAPDLD